MRNPPRLLLAFGVSRVKASTWALLTQAFMRPGGGGVRNLQSEKQMLASSRTPTAGMPGQPTEFDVVAAFAKCERTSAVFRLA
jgi:hypothetical protein